MGANLPECYGSIAVPFLKEFGILPLWSIWFRYQDQLKNIAEYVNTLPKDKPIKIVVHAVWQGEDAYAIAIALKYFYPDRIFEIVGLDFIEPNPQELNWIYVKRIPKYLMGVINTYFIYKTKDVVALKDECRKLITLKQGDMKEPNSFDKGLDIVVINGALGQSITNKDDIRKSIENARTSLRAGGRFYTDNSAYQAHPQQKAKVDEILENDFVKTDKFIRVADGVFEKIDRPSSGKTTKMIGRVGSESFSTLEEMLGMNLNNLPGELVSSTHEYVVQMYGGTIQNAPELYSVEFDTLLDQKILRPIPNEVMSRLNSFKPYDKRWQDMPGENERSARFAKGYKNNTIMTEITTAVEALKTKSYRYVRFPAIFHSTSDYLFGFNSECDEYTKELFSHPTIGLCNEIVGYLQFLDKKNLTEGKPTNLYLEALTHEALHSFFTHEEARILAHYLFSENYPAKKEVEEKGGLLNIALTNLMNIEKAIAYIARPVRMGWPHDRHMAFREIAESILNSDLTYPPLFKKLTKAMLLFSFFPAHPDLSVRDGGIFGWLYHVGATDDLVLAVLWALENPSQLQKVKKVKPYLEQGPREHYALERLLVRRAENRKEDVERFFTPEEKVDIISSAIRFAVDRGWDDYDNEYVDIAFKILPFIPDSAQTDTSPIFTESAKVLEELLYHEKRGVYPHTVEKATFVLKSILIFAEKLGITKFPNEFKSTLDKIDKDDREILAPVKAETRALFKFIQAVSEKQASAISATDALNALPQEWHRNDLKVSEFIAELSHLLQIENVIKQDKSTFIFSEKVTFDNGLGVLLPKLVKSGMRVAVIATNDKQRGLIDELNQGKQENERIIYADTIADIRTKVHTARYYYFKVNGDPVTDLQGVTTFDITEIVKKIIDALGKVCGIVERERIEFLHEAARKFAEAA